MADQAPDGPPKPAPAVGDVKASHQLPAGVASEAAPKQNPAFKAMGKKRYSDEFTMRDELDTDILSTRTASDTEMDTGSQLADLLRHCR